MSWMSCVCLCLCCLCSSLDELDELTVCVCSCCPLDELDELDELDMYIFFPHHNDTLCTKATAGT